MYWEKPDYQQRREMAAWRELAKNRQELARKIHEQIKKGRTWLEIRRAGGALMNDLGDIRKAKKYFRGYYDFESQTHDKAYRQKFELLKSRQEKTRLYQRLVRRMMRYFGKPYQSPLSESLYFPTPRGYIRVSNHSHPNWQGRQIVVYKQ